MRTTHLRPVRLFAALGLLTTSVALTAQRGPAHAVTYLPADVLALACAPSVAYEPPLMALRVTGGQDSFVRRTYAPGDLITINAGTRNGIEVGQEYYVRRPQARLSQRITRETPAGIRTNGWIRIYAIDEEMSLATIVHACETIDVGDYLEPFALPVVPAPMINPPKAQRSNYGRILFGDDGRRTFAKGDFFMVDRGSDHGVTVGSRFVVYRDKRRPENFLYDLGEVAAVEVRPETSTVQVMEARDAMIAGDYVALRK